MGLKIGQTKVFAAKRIDIKMKQKSGYKSVKDIIDAIKRKETSIDTTLKIPSSDETYTYQCRVYRSSGEVLTKMQRQNY